MKRKLSIAVLYSASAYLIYLYGEQIVIWLKTTDQYILVIMIAILMALFPIIPYPLVGGLIGATFGPVSGTIMTWLGSTVASILMFLFVRFGYKDWGIKVLHGNKRISKLTSLFEQNAFLAILFLRMLPMVPSIMINVYSALSRVSFIAYAIASSLGKIPAMLLFAIIGDKAFNDPSQIVTAMTIYSVFLLVTLSFYRFWKKDGLKS